MIAISTASSTAAPSHQPAVFSECLSFQLGAVSYAIDILKVQEIRAYETPTRLFNAPAHVQGVLHLRGVVVPVIDMRTKLGLLPVERTANTVTMVLNLDCGVVGAVVDSVSDVVDLNPDHVKPAPGLSGFESEHCVRGIASIRQGDSEHMLMLLDIDSVLSQHVHPAASAVLQ